MPYPFKFLMGQKKWWKAFSKIIKVAFLAALIFNCQAVGSSRTTPLVAMNSTDPQGLGPVPPSEPNPRTHLPAPSPPQLKIIQGSFGKSKVVVQQKQMATYLYVPKYVCFMVFFFFFSFSLMNVCSRLAACKKKIYIYIYMFSTLHVPKLRGAKNVRFFSFPPVRYGITFLSTKFNRTKGCLMGLFRNLNLL